ncbi:MAG TPA: hypothetical protein VFK78_02120 [Gemmatimonadales bacterium]|nr:hypothetical protein [Gemmatimonadales bacterium]
MRALRTILVAAALAGIAAPAGAQSPADLLRAARTQLEKLNVDSAAVLLRRVSDLSLHASPEELAVGSVLTGAGELILGHEAKARAAFEEALSRDARIRVDTLASLHSRLRRVFEEVRAAPPTVSVTVPSDTVIARDTGALQIVVRTSRAVPLTVEVLAGATAELEASQSFSGPVIFPWKPAGGTAGERTLRVVAHDSGGDRTAFNGSLAVERVTPDTLPVPPPLPDSAFLPESAYGWTRQPRALFRGLGFGAAAAALAALGNEAGGGDGRAIAVGGVISVSGLIGYFKGRRGTHPIPANVKRNRDRRAAEQAARDSIAAVNLARRSAGGLRIIVTGGPS